MERRFSILCAFFMSFLLVVQPFSAMVYANAGPTSVKLIYRDSGKEDEKCQIKEGAEGTREIEILDEHLTPIRTVKCDDLDQILVPQGSRAAGNIATGGVAGGCIGATIGALFFGIGIIPGAMIGIIFGSGATAVATDYDQDVKSDYCGQE